MSREVEEQCVPEWLESGERTNQVAKSSKIAYTKEFLLSFSDLDFCKDLSCGSVQSILSEYGEALTSTCEWERRYSSVRLYGTGGGSYGESPSTRCDSDNYSGVPSGKWGSGSSHLSNGDCCKRSENLARCSRQNPESDLRRGGFPIVSGCTSGFLYPLSREDCDIQLKKSDNPYRPPHVKNGLQVNHRSWRISAVANYVSDISGEKQSEEHIVSSELHEANACFVDENSKGVNTSSAENVSEHLGAVRSSNTVPITFEGSFAQENEDEGAADDCQESLLYSSKFAAKFLEERQPHFGTDFMKFQPDEAALSVQISKPHRPEIPVEEDNLVISTVDECGDIGTCHHGLDTGRYTGKIELDQLNFDETWARISSVLQLEEEVQLAVCDEMVEIFLPDEGSLFYYEKISEGLDLESKPTLIAEKKSKSSPVDNTIVTSTVDECGAIGTCYHGREAKTYAGKIELDQLNFDETWAQISSFLQIEQEVKLAVSDEMVEMSLPDKDCLFDYQMISEGSYLEPKPTLSAEKKSKVSPVAGCGQINDPQDEICLPDEDSLITIDDLLAPYKLMNPFKASTVHCDERCPVPHSEAPVICQAQKLGRSSFSSSDPCQAHMNTQAKFMDPPKVIRKSPPAAFKGFQQNRPSRVPIYQMACYTPVHFMPVNYHQTSYQGFQMPYPNCSVAGVDEFIRMESEANQMYIFGIDGSGQNYRKQRGTGFYAR